MIIKKWEMTYDSYDNIACEAPCSMYSVLLENNLIEDPFYGLNELGYTSLSDKPCSFKSKFEITDEMIEREYIELTFLGLDTICTIFVNEHEIDRVMNMHRTYVYDIKPYVKKGTNTISLHFESPTEYFGEMNNKHYTYSSRNAISGAIHLRKAICMSGWDWGPKFPDMGIFRDVIVDAYDGDRIESIFVTQKHKQNEVELDISVETRHNKHLDTELEIDGQMLRLSKGHGKIIIKNPKLWWVRGYGEQNLYTVSAKLYSGETLIDEKSQRIGLRTLTVSTAPDKHGNEFCFVVNGVKIFAMGANYIPEDSFYARTNAQKTKKLLDACVDANFNCIRVWGGGWYPDNELYDMCDELGIMVWEDFMVACSSVWLTKNMEKEFVQEAICNIKRLRHHASLALLCGNNEMEFILEYWKPQGDSMLVRMDYLRLYERLLPDLCEEYAPQTFYWPSSPSSGGGFEHSGCENKGDTHYWEVWHGGLPFTDYRNHSFRFCSEYGFESYPSVKTIRSFCEEKDMNCFSRVMENHQKCTGGNAKILSYLADNYLYPVSFDNLVYASQLLQADAIKYGVEHFRRMRGICMGSLYWQINDCWPVASWSSVDYFGRYKALHYAAKKFYAPVAMGLFEEDGLVTLNVSNETMNSFEGRAEIRMCSSDFGVVKEYNCDVSVDALSSADTFSFDCSDEDVYTTYVYVDLFDSDGSFIMRQTLLLCKPKHYEWRNPHITYSVVQKDDCTHLVFKSKCFAKGVSVEFKNFDCVLSDNFFDITNSDGCKTSMNGKYTAEQIKENILIKSVYDIGR